jgi:hypothetical protein
MPSRKKKDWCCRAPPNVPLLERSAIMRYVVFGLCVFAAACGSEVPAAPTSPSSAIGGDAVMEAKGGSALPFKGQLQSTEHVVSEDATGALRHLDGTGNATHLGRFTLSADFTVIMATGNATGAATWTAANGDQIRVSVVGHGDIVEFPIVTIVETHTITGGTGRFADASGTITIERSANILTGVSSGSLSGTINLGH